MNNSSPSGGGWAPAPIRASWGASDAIRRLALFGIALLAAACATPKPPPVDALSQHELAYLVDGSTTREDVVLRLGVPSRSFEGDRILLFRLAWAEGAGLAPVAWHAAALAGFDLVLVFDANGILTQHALVAK